MDIHIFKIPGAVTLSDGRHIIHMPVFFPALIGAESQNPGESINCAVSVRFPYISADPDNLSLSVKIETAFFGIEPDSFIHHIIIEAPGCCNSRREPFAFITSPEI